MRLVDNEWRLVSDPFEGWRLHQHVTPLINEPEVGSIILIIADDRSKPPTLLACHTMKAFRIHPAELKLMKGEDIVTLGNCELLKATDSDEVQYRMKTPFHSHRGVIGSAGLAALRKAVSIVS
jgi:hypothetical protein